jgi:bifunctional DNA-binding transcriptional regulator/antitoxin component of YhaV-PrlF toxin-antitoxin module
LKNLFEKGNEERIKKYILEFDENSDDYDIFIQKLQEFVRMNEMDIVEQMIYDDKLTKKKHIEDFDFEEEQDFENYLYGEEDTQNELENIPDELSMENLQDDVGDDAKSIVEDIAGEFGIEDLSK